MSLRKGIWSQFTLESNMRRTRLRLPWCIFFVLKMSSWLSCGTWVRQRRLTHQTRMVCSDCVGSPTVREGPIKDCQGSEPSLTVGLAPRDLNQIIVPCSLSQYH